MDYCLKKGRIMNNIQDQEKCWDELATKKEFPTPFLSEPFSKHVEKEMNILDVGCGYGRTLNELHNHGFKNLIGVDFSDAMINRGLRSYPYLNLIKADGEKLPFHDNEFDSVILIGVLTSNVPTIKQKNLINEISRVLRKNGIIYISDFLLNHDERNLKRYTKYQDKYGIYGIFELPEGLILRHHTVEHILELTNNYEKLLFEKTVFRTMNGNISNGFYFIGKKK